MSWGGHDLNRGETVFLQAGNQFLKGESHPHRAERWFIGDKTRLRRGGTQARKGKRRPIRCEHSSHWGEIGFLGDEKRPHEGKMA